MAKAALANITTDDDPLQTIPLTSPADARLFKLVDTYFLRIAEAEALGEISRQVSIKAGKPGRCNAVVRKADEDLGDGLARAYDSAIAVCAMRARSIGGLRAKLRAMEASGDIVAADDKFAVSIARDLGVMLNSD